MFWILCFLNSRRQIYPQLCMYHMYPLLAIHLSLLKILHLIDMAHCIVYFWIAEQESLNPLFLNTVIPYKLLRKLKLLCCGQTQRVSKTRPAVRQSSDRCRVGLGMTSHATSLQLDAALRACSRPLKLHSSPPFALWHMLKQLLPKRQREADMFKTEYEDDWWCCQLRSMA